MIDLALGAEDHPLGPVFADRIRDNVARDAARARAFRSLRAVVQFVPFETGAALTLRFDHGRLTVHEGSIGVPTVTFGGPLAVLQRLPDLELQGIVPSLRGREERNFTVLRDLARRVARGELVIYGLVGHPRTVLRTLRLLARPR